MIRRCFVRARIPAPAKKGNGGLIGGPNTGDPLIEYILSMSSGDGYRIAGFDVLEHAVEVYEYAGSDSSTNITRENGEHVKETDSVYDRNLWENRISIRNAGFYPEKIGTATEGSYGFESFYTMNWYQSHNDNGSPDTHSFKRLGQEMLGLAGRS